MRRYLVICIILVNWLGPEAQAQSDSCSFHLSGRIIDEHDHSELGFATLYISQLERGVVADESGSYRLDGLCKGVYTVTVRHVSCQPVTIDVEITGDVEKDVFLEHHIEALQAISIESGALSSITNSAQESTLDEQVLDRYRSGSVGDALKQITGVSTLSTGKTLVKPVVQGLYGSRILMVNQGARVQDMEWGEEHAPNIDINSVYKMTLVKGASALKYGGDAVGGTIVIESEPYQADTLFGKISLQGASNGRGGNLSAQAYKSTKDGWFAKVQASYKRFGDFEAPDYFLTNTGVEEKGVSLNLGRNWGPWQADMYYSRYDATVAIMRASHIGNVDDLINALNSREPLVIRDFSYELDKPRQEVTHQLGRLQLNRKLGVNSISFQYDLQHNQRFEFDNRVGDDRDKPAIDLELTTHSLSSDFKWNKWDRLPFEIGALYRFQDNFADPDTGIRRLIPDYNRFELGTYVTTTYQLQPNLIFDAGLRYDFSRVNAKKFYQTSRWEERGYQEEFGELIIDELPTQLLVNPIFDYHNVSATAGVRHLWGQSWQLQFNYALAQRAPNPSELFSDGLHQSASRIELGDLRLGQETSHKVSMQLSQQKSRLSWQLAPYLNRISNFILLEPEGVELTNRGAFPVWEYKQTDALLWGVDVNANVSWDIRWDSEHSFAYLYGQDTEHSRALINMPAPDTRHSLSYKLLSHPITFTLESEYHFKQSRFPDNNFEAFLPLADEFVEVDISTPPEAYHLMHFRVDSEFSVFKQKPLAVGLSINNLFNKKYRDYLNRQRFFGDEVGRNIQLSITLKL